MVTAQRPHEHRGSARKQAHAVVRLLRGESLEALSRELRVEAHRLQTWRDEFVAGGIEGLKGKPLVLEDRRLKEAERKIGELMMENEVLRAVAQERRHEEGSPPAKQDECATLAVSRRRTRRRSH